MSKGYVIIASVAASFVVLFTGCMVSGMCGGMMQGSSESTQSTENRERLVKELRYGNYTIIAEFPPLRLSETTIFSLQIKSSVDSVENAAKVRIRVKNANSTRSDAIVEKLLSVSNDSTFKFSFSPSEKGVYDIEFLIEELGNVPLEKPLTLSARQEIAMMENDQRNSIGSSSPVIIGGVIMATMMLVMLGLRLF